MTTTGATTESIAAAVESAGFVRIVARADGGALAAAGVLARGLAARGTPFQVSVAATVGERTERANATAGGSAEPTVVIGPSNADAHHVDPADRPASLAACELVRALGERPDPILGLAGAFAAGVAPGADGTEQLVDAARERGIVERRPGVAVPTADPVDGLAHTTLVRAPWSGDTEAVREALGRFAGRTTDEPTSTDDEPTPTDDELQSIGSLVALDAVGDEAASPRSAESVGRVLRPHALGDGPFATIGGYADVLEATARTEPGTGVALAIGHDVRAAALDAWRDHGRRVHGALETASTGRYDGLFVVGVDDEAGANDPERGTGVLESIARVVAAYRSPEPVVLTVGDGVAGLATTLDGPTGDGGSGSDEPLTNDETGDDRRSIGGAVEAAAREIDAAHDRSPRGGSLRYDPAREDGDVIEAVRRAL